MFFSTTSILATTLAVLHGQFLTSCTFNLLFVFSPIIGNAHAAVVDPQMAPDVTAAVNCLLLTDLALVDVLSNDLHLGHDAGRLVWAILDVVLHRSLGPRRVVALGALVLAVVIPHDGLGPVARQSRGVCLHKILKVRNTVLNCRISRPDKE